MFARKLTGFMSAEWPQTGSVMQCPSDQMETFVDDENVKRVQRAVARSPHRLG